MLRLQQADLSEMHGAVWLCLLAAVQGQSRFARHQAAGLCAAKGRCGIAPMAQSRPGDSRSVFRGCAAHWGLDLVDGMGLQAEGYLLSTISRKGILRTVY